MSFIIQDGTGTATKAKVDPTNKLNVRAVTRNERVEGSLVGESFTVGSGPIQLTSANESAVLFFQNDETRDLLVRGLNVSMGTSTGGSTSVGLLEVYRNPTGLSSGSGNDAGILNTNFASSKLLTSTSEKGQEGATVSGGTIIATLSPYPLGQVTFIDTALVLPKGTSIGFAVTPPASNTSMLAAILLEVTLVKEGTTEED